MREDTKWVTVRIEDLRLLLTETESFVGTVWPASAPVTWAIDRMGDEVLKATAEHQL